MSLLLNSRQVKDRINFFKLYRFMDEQITAELLDDLAVNSRKAGDQNDPGPGGSLARLLDEFKARDVRHAAIQKHVVKIVVFDKLLGVLSVEDNRHFHLLSLKISLEIKADILLIVRDQDLP